MTEFWSSVVTIFLAVIAIAGLAVLVSKQSQTGQVVKDIASGTGGLLQVALSPVTGTTGAGLGGYNPSLSTLGGAGYLG